jgi:hypothetical protein
VSRAIEILASSDYRIDDDSAGRKDVFRQDKHILMVHEKSAAKAEIHWAVARPDEHVDIPFDMLWDRREYVSILGTPVPTPSLNDLLLILSVHGASHSWTSFKWVCDVAAMIRACGDSEWIALRCSAQHRGCLRLVLLAIALATEVTGIAIPPTAARDIDAEPSVIAISQSMFDQSCTMTKPDYFNRFLTRIRCRERLTARAQIAASYAWASLSKRGLRVRAWGKSTPVLRAIIGN